MCAIDDCDERVEVFQASDRVGRKQHHCSECDRAISIGEAYRYEFGKLGGLSVTYKTCAHCMIGRQWLLANCGGWIYQGVLDEIREHAEEYPKIALGLYRIAFAGSRKWQKKMGGLMPVPKMPQFIESIV